MKRPLIGISSCLLGNPVRYNNGHKRDRYITDVLEPFVQFVPVCPEAECGLGIPREAMRLVGDPAAPRLVTSRSGIDHTDRMKRWAEKKLRDLAKQDLCGFIFKAKSPSSGMRDVRVYTEKKMPSRKGVGIFARAFMERFPLIPAEDEGRLHDDRLRENFIERAFARQRWLALKRTRGALVAFHTRHKLTCLSHSTTLYRELGALVGTMPKGPAAAVYQDYEALFFRCLGLPATPKKHTNVLQHIMGYFKKLITAEEKKELQQLITRYHNGLVPLVVPLTLINHYVKKFDVAYLKDQCYLEPHPAELMLRNRV